jgi:hypothetical protein
MVPLTCMRVSLNLNWPIISLPAKSVSESTSELVEDSFQASSLVWSTSFAGDFYVKATR